MVVLLVYRAFYLIVEFVSATEFTPDGNGYPWKVSSRSCQFLGTWRVERRSISSLKQFQRWFGSLLSMVWKVVLTERTYVFFELFPVSFAEDIDIPLWLKWATSGQRYFMEYYTMIR